MHQDYQACEAGQGILVCILTCQSHKCLAKMLHSLLTDPSVSSDDFVTDMLIQRHMQCNIFVFLGDVTPHCVISREVRQTTDSSDTTELRISGTFRRSNLGPTMCVIF